MTRSSEGFCEIEHTADWELEVWGPDVEALFNQAALGMFSLLGVRLAAGRRNRRSMVLQAPDSETLLVDFLNELLFLADTDGFAPDRMDLTIRGGHLDALIEGASIAGSSMERRSASIE